jgi:hypothetical protein
MMQLTRNAWYTSALQGKSAGVQLIVKEVDTVYDWASGMKPGANGLTEHFYGFASKSFITVPGVKRCLHNFLFKMEEGRPVVYSREWVDPNRGCWQPAQGGGWPVFKVETDEVRQWTPPVIAPSPLKNFKEVESKLVSLSRTWRRTCNDLLSNGSVST